MEACAPTPALCYCQKMQGDDVSDGTFEEPVSVTLEPSVVREAHLFIVLEGERPLAGGARYSVDGYFEIVLRRGAQRETARKVVGRIRQLSISIPDRRMSATHARLVWSGDRWIFEDLHSRNGALVNGRLVKRAVLQDRDLIQVGHTFFLLRTGLPTPDGTSTTIDASNLIPERMGMRTLTPALATQFALMKKVVQAGVAVHLSGETGTGKELLARAVHELASKGGPLIAVNCGAIPRDLVESQLFGHVRGAFSGAIRDELGFIRAANHGTLFLDEIADLPLVAQPALLRVLQEREVMPVGSRESHHVTFRVVSATHESLAELVSKGFFREDLQARLEGFSFHLPPLRDRRGDLGLLLADLLPLCPPIASIDPSAAWALLQYRWPQNVRELAGVLTLGSVLAEGGALRAAHLPAAVTHRSPTESRIVPNDVDAAPSAFPRRDELIAHLERERGNVAGVARAMEMHRSQLYRWLKASRLDPKAFRGCT